MEGIRVNLRLLGVMQVEVDGQPVSHFRSQKTMALLGFLVAEQRPVARSYLAELFWPEATPTSGRAHLRRAIYDLTQKVPGALLIDNYSIQFNPALAAGTDLARFESLRAHGYESALAAAALCHGQFLEGMAFDDCPEFEMWLLVERATWRKRATAVVELILEKHLRDLHFDMALESALQLVRLDPWREKRYLQLMVLLARNGAIEQAIRVYKRFRRILAKELGLEPSAELDALYERLRQWHIRPPACVITGVASPFNYAPQPVSVIHQLADPACRLLTLTGPANSGKTRLAIEAAACASNPVASLFLDGVYLVRLSEIATPAHFLAAMAHSLGITRGAAVVTLEMVQRRVRDREILLMLDGFDQLLAHKALLTALLNDAPQLKILVTCRERLNLPLEHVLTLAGHDSEATLAQLPRLLENTGATPEVPELMPFLLHQLPPLDLASPVKFLQPMSRTSKASNWSIQGPPT